MKCAILLLLVAAASGLTIMPMINTGFRSTIYSASTGLPMSFLRKKRDADEAKKSVAIHVANTGMFWPQLTIGGSPFFYRKKRSADDQQADDSMFMYSMPYAGHNIWNNGYYGYWKK